MRRPALLAALAVLLAGCAAPDVAPAAGVEAPADAAREAGEAMLMPCVEHAADFPVDMAEAQAFLPDGMQPRRAAPNGPPLLEVVTVACGEDEPTRGVFAWMLVEPPEALRASGVAGYLYVFAAVVDDPAVAASLVAAGVPATVGEVEFATAETPGTVAGRGGTAAEGWSVALETLVPKRQLARSHPVFRALVANETGVTHGVDVDGGSHPHHDPGQATLRVEGDAPFPAPQAPGLAVHGIDGHLGFRYVAPDALAEPPEG